MRSFSISFAIGICSLLLWQQLPYFGWFFLIALFITLLLILKRSSTLLQSSLLSMLALFLGISWALFYAHAEQTKRLPLSFIKQTITVQGYIASIPEHRGYAQRFEFIVTKMQPFSADFPLPNKIRLSWGGRVTSLQPGDQWQLQVHLEPPRGLLNPDAFDETVWLFEHRIHAIGYVLPYGDNRLLNSKKYHASIDRFRQHLANLIQSSLQYDKQKQIYTGFITALSVGIRNNISQDQWQVLRNTGTNHLMAIAGLHIGFVALLTYFFFRYFCCLFPSLIQKLPATELATFTSLMLAIAYSTLAGFSLPTQRAIIMLTVFLIVSLLRRKLPRWHAWSFALLIVLILDPLAVLSPSFWLSFVTVALIIYGSSNRLHQPSKYQHWFYIQWIITIGLIPLMLLFFQQISLAGLLANAVAIPWVGFFILPLCLLGSFLFLVSFPLGALVIKIAIYGMIPLWFLLSKISAISWLQWHGAIRNTFILIGAFIAILLLLAPRGFPSRYLGIFFFLPIFFIPPISLAPGEMQLILFDVKKGLTALIRTNGNALIYTTQPYPLMNSIVSPYLQTQGIKKYILIRKNCVNSQYNNKEANENNICWQDKQWQSGGINFLLTRKGLLKLENAQHELIVTPDILLLKKMALKNRAIIITSHIRPKRSGPEELSLNANFMALQFLESFTPDYLLFSGEWQEGIIHDLTTICATLKIHCYTTTDSGAIEINIPNNAKPSLLLEYRNIDKHFWVNPRIVTNI